MDGGSDLNIMYADTLDAMGINRLRTQLSEAPFHGIMPGKQAMPLEKINMPITFGNLTNYRMETLTFEVVGFKGTYHAILGRPCYAKFMAGPNYTYLKLKMSGPNSVITVESMYEHAYDCDVECIEYAEAIVEAKALIVNLDQLDSEVPDSKRRARTFEPIEAVKLVPIDPTDPTKMVRIGTQLPVK